jgi:hypothetical protein
MKTPEAFSSKGGKSMGTGGATPIPKSDFSKSARDQAVGKTTTPRKNGPC